MKYQIHLEIFPDILQILGSISLPDIGAQGHRKLVQLCIVLIPVGQTDNGQDFFEESGQGTKSRQTESG